MANASPSSTANHNSRTPPAAAAVSAAMAAVGANNGNGSAPTLPNGQMDLSNSGVSRRKVSARTFYLNIALLEIVIQARVCWF